MWPPAWPSADSGTIVITGGMPQPVPAYTSLSLGTGCTSSRPGPGSTRSLMGHGSLGSMTTSTAEQLPPGPEPADSPGADETRVDRALLAVAAVVVLGTIMSILDTTVVNVAIRTLAVRFNTTLPTIQWVATGYTLALAAVIPLSGWIADRFGTKRLYMISIALFLCGSALSGIAWSAGSIILFRVLQGLGGGMIMPAGMTILTRAAGPQRIGRVMSIIGVPMLLGPILGPILGGWLVADVSWRWIFFINVPIGFVALVLALRILPRDVPAHDQKLDFVDFLLLSPGLALAIYGLAETNSAGGFGSPKVLVPLLAGIALLCAFVWHALRASAPLVDLRLFKDRTFAMSSTMLVLVVISVFGSFLLLPLYFQTVRAESALQSGLLLAPQGLGAMLAMPVAGILSDRMGPGKIVPFGLLAIIGAVLWLTQIGPDTSYVGTSIDLFVFGFGMGFTMMPTFTGAMQSIRKEAVARGSTALNILQQTGASIGTAVLTVILASGLTDRLGPGANAAGGGGSIGAAIPHHVASLMADAFGHTFWWALALLIAAFVFSLALPKRKPANATSGPPISMA
jgi:EmrB/QacA subfamily drug resistance transporter